MVPLTPVPALVAPSPQIEVQASGARSGGGTLVLPEMLSNLDWNPQERGALIVVSPETARAQMVETPLPPNAPPDYEPPKRYLRVEDLPAPTGKGYHVFTLEKAFDRKLFAAGSVSVFAPREMQVLNWQRLPPPNAYAGMSRATKLKLLEASLTPAQWQMYVSENGIGATDLNRDQATLFWGSIPENAQIQEIKVDANGRQVYQAPTPLSPTDRAGIRMSLRRQMTWTYLMSNGGQLSFGNSGGSRTIVSRRRFSPREERSPLKLFDATVSEWVANRPKPGNLNFASESLGASVSLVDAKTVGELVERCAAATRVEVHCDPRYAKLSVFVRGDGARAGDILRALALGVRGTYRQLGATFVLTDDLVPLGVRIARLGEWIDANLALAGQRDSAANKTVGSKRWDTAPWASDDPNRPSAGLERRIEEFRKKRREPWTEEDAQDPNRRHLTVPVGELPLAAQEQVRKNLSQDLSFGENVTVRKDVVVPTASAQRYYILAGRGAFAAPDASYGGSDDESISLQPQRSPVPEAQPLPRSETTALRVSAESPEVAEQRVALAQRKGFDAVWVAARGDDLKILAAATAAGKKAGISVWASANPLRQPGPSALTDITVLGETPLQWAKRNAGDVSQLGQLTSSWFWRRRQRMQQANEVLRTGDLIRLDLEAGKNLARARLRGIAALPDLAGVAVQEIFPPGFHRVNSFTDDSTLETGYSPEMRLAFLRANHFDPADLATRPAYLSFELSRDADDMFRPDQFGLESFPSWGPETNGQSDSGRAKWVEYRSAMADSLVQSLRSAGLPVPVLFNIGSYYGSLDRGLPKQMRETNFNTSGAFERAQLANAQESSSRLAMTMPFYRDAFYPEPIRDSFARWSNAMARMSATSSLNRWQSRVYDLTLLNPTEQTFVLEKIVLAPKP